MNKMTEKMKEWMKEITQILFIFSVLAISLNHVKMMPRTYPFYLA